MVLAGDAAGVVAPASGEGIYYAMVGGRLAAEAVERCLATGDARALGRRAQAVHEGARPGVLDSRHHAALLVRAATCGASASSSICRDTDVQQLTLDAYMNKELVAREPVAHVRIFFKDLAHLLGLVRA